MTINTKYNTGDTFWMIDRRTRKPKEYVVTKVTICVDFNSTEEYVDGSRFTENVKKVYKSKAELIEALANG